MEEWETVSLDLVRWNILLKQIEDLSLLSTILSQEIKFDSAILPLIPHHDEVEFSVYALLEKGKGICRYTAGFHISIMISFHYFHSYFISHPLQDV